MMADPRFIFGKNVQILRRSLNLSQEKLADLTQLHRTYIGGIERGERNVSLFNIIKLAKALQTTPSKLLENII